LKKEKLISETDEEFIIRTWGEFPISELFERCNMSYTNFNSLIKMLRRKGRIEGNLPPFREGNKCPLCQRPAQYENKDYEGYCSLYCKEQMMDIIMETFFEGDNNDELL